MRNPILHIFVLLLTVLFYVTPSEEGLINLSRRWNPIKPTDDPFYIGPPGFKNKPPGTILRHRPLPTPIIVGNNGNLKVRAAYQILFRTTDSEGNAEAAITTLIIPEFPNYKKLLSYQTAYDSAYVNCGPSYTLLQGADTSNGTTTSGSETLLIQAALQQGWVVDTPDYEGDKAAYVSDPQAAHAVLDSVRAVLKSGGFSQVASDATYAMWGYSRGCVAAGWASEIQPAYAKELNFVGAACGGLVPDVTNAVLTVNGTESAGLGPSGTMGLAQSFRNLSRYVDSRLVPSKAAKFKGVLTQCFSDATIEFANQDIFSYFRNGGASDEISPVEDTDALYSTPCERGANIYYARDLKNTHGAEGILGAPAALGWLKNRLDGFPAAKGCNQEFVAWSTLSIDSIEVLGSFVYASLVGMLGDPGFLPA